MPKSRLPLLILLLALACVLCLCAAVTGFAVYEVLRSVTDVDLPQMQALLPPLRQPGTLDPFAPPRATSLPAARATTPVNRIVVQSSDGNLYTIRPDGTDRVPLTQDGAELRIYRQPTWSPDAQRVAWVEVEGSNSGLTSALVIARPDGSAPTRVDTGDSPPFYLAWSPDGARIAALGSADRGLALQSIDIAGSAAPTVIAQAQPLYFAWAPDSARLVAHLNGDKVSLLSLDGRETELDDRPAPFGAPGWMADGAAFVYAQRAGGAQKLVLADPGGVTLRDVADFSGSATFGLSPDGERLAFIDSTEMVPTAAFGPLALASLSGDAPPQVIDDGPVLAFFWSPAGDKLAYLTPGDFAEQGPRASLDTTLEADHLNLWLRWHVWDGERSYELGQFRPSDTFLVDYLRFFDQYARSMTPWAPDGSAFVYAGDSEDAISGVWVQPAAEGASPRRIGDGVYAAWSPR